MTGRGHLMTPGPTPIPPAVAAAMAEPILYHRGPEFRDVLARVLPRLSEVFRTRSPVVLLTASGTGAMESAVANLCSPGERVLVVSAGHFGERWVQIARRYGCDVVELAYEWGEVPDAADVQARLAESGAGLVFCTYCDTSTGVVADVQGIATRVKAGGALCVVDAISALGALPLETDEWGIDAVVSGSQKALMTPPGLAFAAASDAALERARASTSPRYYLDWERALTAQDELRNPFTPAVSLVRGLDAALDLLLAEGLEAAWGRARRLGRACRAGVKAMGLELFSPDDDRSVVVTAIGVPDGVDGTAVVRTLRERSGITIAGGQGPLRGKIVRIGHIGHVGLDDVAAALEGLELVLTELGVAVEPGVAAASARDAYEQGVTV